MNKPLQRREKIKVAVLRLLKCGGILVLKIKVEEIERTIQQISRFI